ncbi:Demethylspheroidene O-methyltransferase [Rhodovastum atsumiense]|uniref:Methyltransferase domain-containing protein n=1 Tax=Rhodovastum atsumiense TaxID=504468 RepID=A0A5M6IZS7_9PROT|nr:methyltransferase [Rhodovastum atsumiense]KAA5612885.1 methyltransferase domain-containing protein [Rhodovastum atsumiense]CAH2601038.1 Demethylspheroidene O-methyltransferase [Rhodovastum atsumiense]
MPFSTNLRDRLLGWRDRVLGDPRFQRWAAGFPLTRRIARRDAQALFDLVAGFVYSQILYACVRLRVFDMLQGAPQELDVLASRMGMPPEAAARLLDGAVALRLLSRRGVGRYGLGRLGAALVGNAGIAAMVEHHAMLYADLADPVALLRGERPTTELGRYWPYAGSDAAVARDPEAVAGYTALMAASQPMIAAEVLDAYPLQRHRCLLDVGGGNGTFLIAAAARAPALQLTLFDLPPVAASAATRFAAAGLEGRARAVAGDFRLDPLPAGADIVSLVRIIHDHDDATVLTLLRAVHRALPPGGTLLIAEPMSGTPGAEAVGDAYFGLYLFAMGRGRPRTPAAIETLLKSAGFSVIRRIPTRSPMLTSVMVATMSGSGQVAVNPP